MCVYTSRLPPPLPFGRPPMAGAAYAPNGACRA